MVLTMESQIRYHRCLLCQPAMCPQGFATHNCGRVWDLGSLALSLVRWDEGRASKRGVAEARSGAEPAWSPEAGTMTEGAWYAVWCCSESC